MADAFDTLSSETTKEELELAAGGIIGTIANIMEVICYLDNGFIPICAR